MYTMNPSSKRSGSECRSVSQSTRRRRVILSKRTTGDERGRLYDAVRTCGRRRAHDTGVELASTGVDATTVGPRVSGPACR